MIRSNEKEGWSKEGWSSDCFVGKGRATRLIPLLSETSQGNARTERKKGKRATQNNTRTSKSTRREACPPFAGHVLFCTTERNSAGNVLRLRNRISINQAVTARAAQARTHVQHARTSGDVKVWRDEPPPGEGGGGQDDFVRLGIKDVDRALGRPAVACHARLVQIRHRHAPFALSVCIQSTREAWVWHHTERFTEKDETEKQRGIAVK